MNVLLFTLEYPPFKGGIANYYVNLVKYWPKPDNIFVLNNNDGRLINKSWPILKWLPAIFALRQAVKKNKIEHIIIGQILPLGLVGLIYRQFYQIEYSVVLHGLDFSYAAKLGRKRILTKIILERAERIVCANVYTEDLVKKSFSRINKTIVVNPGIKNITNHNPQIAAQLKQKYNLDDKIILLSVGRLVKRKGFDKVIEALPEILKQAPNLVYVILGNGEELENLKLKNNVLIISRATDEERDSWYNICDIFIMPARNINGDFEGFGIVYLEANLAGKPVIAGRSGGVDDAVIDGLNGLLVDPKDTSQIASAVIKLARDPRLRQKLGQQGRERAINDFDWGKQIKKIYQIISPFNKGGKAKFI